MTGQQVFNAWNDPEITDIYEAAVLMAICDEADERGISRPRIEDICRKARCKERSVKYQIKSLVAKKKITVTVRKGTSSEYQVLGCTTCTTPKNQPMHDVPLLSAPNAPHSISVLKDLSINRDSIKDTSVLKEHKTAPITKPTLASIVKTYDPDEPEITNKVGHITKKRGKRDPALFPLAKEIAGLCSLALGNGADGELFRAAKLIHASVNAPKTPLELRPFFAKGGKIYGEWPWNSGERLKPMDIVKHWPRLSGAVKPPSVEAKKRVYAEEV